MMRYEAMVAAAAAVMGFVGATREGGTPAVQEAAAVGSVAVAGQEDFRWSGRLARGQEIEINGIIGNVTAETASGDQVEVIGRRRGAGAADVRIEAVETRDGITICTIYPQRGGRNGRRTDVDGDGPCRGNNGNIDGDDARIDFTVRVPAGVKLAANTVSGDIVAEGLRSPVEAASVSGDVRVSTSGPARASTVSGDVVATFAQTDSDEMEFNSVSGDVTLRLAGNVGAEVEAQTLSGEIHSDFPLRRGHMTDDDDDDDDDGGVHVDIRIGQSARGTIGRGGAELSVTTISGDIRLERAR
ncbi:MAG TPA: DUF4097 family beta strand repeat-containing protein [Longimicrobium sp.]|jgi:hypothetical protein|uniref:DUF4097 family beta strand repeat-containing protein n=1 Tax=Longimicrobium sp. TaxID=2029185 RepID=UPI002EDAE108